MPTSHDALGFWGISAILAAYLGLCIRFGAVPKKSGGFLRRADNSVAFWIVIAICGAGLFVLVFLALLASVSWPPAG